MPEQERRFGIVRGAELRAQGGRKLTGYGVIFNQLSEDMGGWRELIVPGAFTRSVEDGDVRFLWNHSVSDVLGRTRSGTLALREDAAGIRFEVELPNTRAGEEAYSTISRGDVSQCSFGFVAKKDRWVDGGKQRELLSGELLEISPCTFPAYPQTSVGARAALRALWPEAGTSSVAVYSFRALDPALETERLRARFRLMELEAER